MKQFLATLAIGVFAVLGLTLVSPPRAAAHVLKIDHGISGELHIPPDDTPEANTPTELHLSFGDIAQQFNLEHCDCHVSVLKNEKTVQTVALQPVLPDDTLVAKATVTFPEPGDYDIAVSGTSKDGSFSAFGLEYDATVGKADQKVVAATKRDNVGVDTAILGLTVLAILSSGLYWFGRKKT